MNFEEWASTWTSDQPSNLPLDMQRDFYKRLVVRAAELFTRHITVAPAGYDQDVKEWLHDAGFGKEKTK
jgi:hypothetical protein